jgi:hypothetical protein
MLRGERWMNYFALPESTGPEWIDAYSVGGKSFLNYVWRPAVGGWLSYFLVTGSKYQQVFNDAKEAGFTPVFVESSLAGGQPRYTAIFRQEFRMQLAEKSSRGCKRKSVIKRLV